MTVFSQLTSPTTTVAVAPRFHSNRPYSRRKTYTPITTTVFSPPPAATAIVITLKAHSYNPRRNNPNPDKFKLPISIPPLPPIVKKNLLKATLYGAAANLLFFLLQGGGGGSNNAGKLLSSGGGGGGGGWTNADFLSRLFTVQRLSKEEGSASEPESESESKSKLKTQFYRVGSPLYMLGRLRKYQISDVLFFDKRLGEFTDPTDDVLFRQVTLLPGQVYSKAQLQKELENLTKSGLFEEIDVDCKRNRDNEKTLRLRISFLERTWSGPAERMRCINVGSVPNWNPTVEIIPNKKVKEIIGEEYQKRIESARPCLLPESLQEEISERMRMTKEKNGGTITARVLAKVKERVERWYSDNGYACAQVVSFGKLDSAEVVCEVAEGDIAGVQVIGGGAAVVEEVQRVLPMGLRKGEVFNIEVAEQAKLSIDSLGMFCNTEIDLGLDEKNGGGVLVKFKVEKKVKIVD